MEQLASTRDLFHVAVSFGLNEGSPICKKQQLASKYERKKRKREGHCDIWPDIFYDTSLEVDKRAKGTVAQGRFPASCSGGHEIESRQGSLKVLAFIYPILYTIVLVGHS